MTEEGRKHIREMTGMGYGVFAEWTTESAESTVAVPGRRSWELRRSRVDQPIPLGDRSRLGAVDDA
jgi:hypothetical protein